MKLQLIDCAVRWSLTWFCVIPGWAFAVVFSDPAVASSREQKYAVGGVSPRLMTDPSSLIRIESTNFRVINRRSAEMKVTIATTVFRSDKRSETDLILYYNRFQKIDDLDGSIYNSQGDKIRSLDDECVRDYSAVSDYSLFEDTRAKVVSMYSDVYPYTIEYEYTIEFDGYINWPVWMAQASNEPVERSVFEVEISSGDSLRYWCNFDSLKPRVTLEGGNLTYRWESGQLPARSPAEMSENPLERTPIVRIAPRDFEIDRQAGDMTSWKSFGAWYHRLSLEKDILPANACKEIDGIKASPGGTRELIAKLYKYMQARTRYVSIQLGIGGWMPFDATYVHERGYGDCKALSNYMVSILARASIKAYPALIANGSSASVFVDDFPSNQFNHCIVVVPLETDSLWLECTDPHAPVGLIGYSNEGRSALVITAEGGQLVSTPESQSWENIQHNVGTVTLDNFGNGKSDLSISWGGNQRDEVRGALVGATPDEKSRWVHEKLRQSEINSLDYRLTGLDPDDASTNLTATCLIQRYANPTGNRLFFTPNLFNQRTYIPPEDSDRRSSVQFSYAYQDVDSLVYRFSENFTPEALPASIELKTMFGSFHSSVRVVDATSVVYVRDLNIHSSSIPPGRYAEYRKFFSDIAKADKAKVVLLRK